MEKSGEGVMDFVSLDAAKAIFDALAEDVTKADKKVSAAISIIDHPTEADFKVVKIRSGETKREFKVHKKDAKSLHDHIQSLGAKADGEVKKSEVLETLQKACDSKEELAPGVRVWIDDVILFERTSALREELVKAMYPEELEKAVRRSGNEPPERSKEPSHPKVRGIKEGDILHHTPSGVKFTVHAATEKLDSKTNKVTTHHELHLKADPGSKGGQFPSLGLSDGNFTNVRSHVKVLGKDVGEGMGKTWRHLGRGKQD